MVLKIPIAASLYFYGGGVPLLSKIFTGWPVSMYMYLNIGRWRPFIKALLSGHIS